MNSTSNNEPGTTTVDLKGCPFGYPAKAVLLNLPGWLEITAGHVDDNNGHKEIVLWLASQFRKAKLVIPEPQGLGAVVRDANGIHYTRTEFGGANCRNPWLAALPGEANAAWDEIDSPEVLAGGVPA